MRNKAIIAIALVMIGLFVFLLSCGDDDPVGPPPSESKHLFFIAPLTGNLIKVFSVENKQFIDSFYVDSISDTSSIYRMHVIGDDAFLAISTKENTYIFDLKCRKVTESFYGEWTVFSRDSRYYFSKNNNSRHWELRIYPEHTLIYDDVPTLMLPFFSNDSRYLAASDTYIDSSEFVTDQIIYDISTGVRTAIRKRLSDQNVNIFEKYPSSSYQKLFLGGNTLYTYYFAVTDFNSDSIRVIKYLSQDMASAIPVISPDGKYVYFSEQVMEAWSGIPDGKIYVYNAETEDSVAVIEYEGIRQPHSFVITYDNKYLIADPVNEFKDETNVCLIDALNFQVIGVYDFHDLPGCVTSKWAAHGGGNYRL
ncbi:MAG: hypothetical protein AB1746_09965 [Candidatus Zixiibacteriota bacterium]